MSGIFKESWKLKQILANFSFIRMLIHKKEWIGLFCNHGKLNSQGFMCVSIYLRFFHLNSALMTYCKLSEIGVVSDIFLQYQESALKKKTSFGEK